MPAACFNRRGFSAEKRFRPEAPYAGVAHPVERHLAKVEVASSSLVARSNFKREFPWRELDASTCAAGAFGTRRCGALAKRSFAGCDSEFEPRRPLHFFQRNRILRRHSQVVRQGTANPRRPGSNPGGASKDGAGQPAPFFTFVGFCYGYVTIGHMLLTGGGGRDIIRT